MNNDDVTGSMYFNCAVTYESELNRHICYVLIVLSYCSFCSLSPLPLAACGAHLNVPWRWFILARPRPRPNSSMRISIGWFILKASRPFVRTNKILDRQQVGYDRSLCEFLYELSHLQPIRAFVYIPFWTSIPSLSDTIGFPTPSHTTDLPSTTHPHRPHSAPRI